MNPILWSPGCECSAVFTSFKCQECFRKLTTIELHLTTQILGDIVTAGWVMLFESMLINNNNIHLKLRQLLMLNFIFATFAKVTTPSPAMFRFPAPQNKLPWIFQMFIFFVSSLQRIPTFLITNHFPFGTFCPGSHLTPLNWQKVVVLWWAQLFSRRVRCLQPSNFSSKTCHSRNKVRKKVWSYHSTT